MTDWSDGYVADIGYTFGYFAELNPARMRFAFLNAGVVPPKIETACELGFGQGVSVNMHAAGSPVEWWGTDFIPSQASFASEFAKCSGAVLKDEAFQAFCARDDLPEFDFIALHGIWSWINEENRKTIVDFVRRKLRLGGVLYISYNAMPGWAAFAPTRHLLSEYGERAFGSANSTLDKVDGAIQFIEKFLATDPNYKKANPQVDERFARIKQQSRHYLAHEYFNGNWEPMYFLETAKHLSPAKVQFACSALYADHIDGINHTPEQLAFLRGVQDPSFREAVRDYMVNQQFRRDYWVRGVRRLSSLERVEAIRAERFVLMSPRSEITLKLTGSLGEATMSEAIYNPLLDVMGDFRPHTVASLEEQLAPHGIQLKQIIECIIALLATGHISGAQDPISIEHCKERARRLNCIIKRGSRSSNEMAYLVSPVIGGGVPVPRFHQLFLLAMDEGEKHPVDWARYAWGLLSSQGQKISLGANVLETDEENLAELTKQAKQFQNQLPVLQALGI